MNDRERWEYPLLLAMSQIVLVPSCVAVVLALVIAGFDDGNGFQP